MKIHNLALAAERKKPRPLKSDVKSEINDKSENRSSRFVDLTNNIFLVEVSSDNRHIP